MAGSCESVRVYLPAAIAALLSLTSCGGGTEPEVATDDPPTETAAATRDRPASGGNAEGPPSAGAGAVGAGRASSEQRSGSVGMLGPTLLSAEAPVVTVEVDDTGETSLHPQAREGLDGALRDHGRKGDVRFTGQSELPVQDVYTLGDLHRLSDRHDSGGDRPEPVIHVLALPGRYERDDVTGIAFRPNAFAVFVDRLDGTLLGVSGDRGDFHEAVAVHELGHLFGLVNLTGHGAFHEDARHPGHADDRSSVMFWAVEDVSVSNILRGGPPRTFNAADIEEMRRIRR